MRRYCVFLTQFGHDTDRATELCRWHRSPLKITQIGYRSVSFHFVVQSGREFAIHLHNNKQLSLGGHGRRVRLNDYENRGNYFTRIRLNTAASLSAACRADSKSSGHDGQYLMRKKKRTPSSRQPIIDSSGGCQSKLPPQSTASDGYLSIWKRMPKKCPPDDGGHSRRYI